MIRVFTVLLLIFSTILVHAENKKDDSAYYEFVPDVSYELVADRLSCLDTEIPLHFNETVHAFVDYFAVRDREYTKLMMQRRNVFFPIFEEALKRHGLPDELKYLSIVESGLNTSAVSRVGAVGLWQFMPYTGKMFKLDQNWYLDERMDPYKATEAACKYLKELYGYFHDWELALASYNAGPGNVRRAIRRSGYKKSFWEVYSYLPRETRSYVPQLIAVIYVLNYAAEHNLFIDDKDYQMAYDQIDIDGYLHLNTLADLLGICPEDIAELNPELKRMIVPENSKDYKLRLPADKMELLALNMDTFIDSAANTGKEEIKKLAQNSTGSTYGREKIVYRVRSGDVLGSIAERYHVRVSDLRAWNNIRGNLIRVGQHLNVYVRSQYANNSGGSSSDPAPIPASKVHLVQPGDSLWKISRQYQGLSIEKIMKLNNLKTSEIKPGQKLVIG